MIDISKKLKELREEKGCLQKDVAKEIGIAKNTLSQFENGQGRPSYEVLTALARFYNVTSDYLLGLEDEYGNKIKFKNNIHITNNNGNINIH